MTLTEATGAIATLSGFIVAATTYYSMTRSARKAVTDSTVTTWQGLSAEYKAERNALRVELNEKEEQLRQLENAIRQLENAGRKQSAADQERIRNLETEITALRQHLYRADPSSS